MENPWAPIDSLRDRVNSTLPRRLRVAAIRFLNPAPLMWDFEHPPLNAELAERYEIKWMLPSQCADELAVGSADIGLVPIAALATTPGLRILPGCTIASKGKVRSLLLVRRANQPLEKLHSVAADTASRTTLAYSRILFHKWGNAEVPFIPMTADLDAMLDRADAAILIGDPALMALEERANRFERTRRRTRLSRSRGRMEDADRSPLRLRRLGSCSRQTLGRGYRQGFHPIARSRITKHRRARRALVSTATAIRGHHPRLPHDEYSLRA